MVALCLYGPDKIPINLLSKLDLASLSVLRKFEQAQHHDERAALICLLTAMFARFGDAVIVGDRWRLVLATPDDILGFAGIGGIGKGAWSFAQKPLSSYRTLET